MFENAYLIHRYTRADSLRHGVLIDVSATAREPGQEARFPVVSANLSAEMPCGRTEEFGNSVAHLGPKRRTDI
jgi:hypothetical protein